MMIARDPPEAQAVLAGYIPAANGAAMSRSWKRDILLTRGHGKVGSAGDGRGLAWRGGGALGGAARIGIGDRLE